MAAVPLSWLSVQLGDVVHYGKTEKCEFSDVTGDTWILELEDIEKDSSKIMQRLDATARPFKSTKNKFSKGDILYGKLRPYLNKVVIADSSGVCSTEIIPLNAEPYIDNRYLFYWLKSEMFLDFVNSVSYGVNMPRLGTQDGLAAPFVVAPLAEQKVIADKLDALLAQVETIKARLERVPELIKTFRQSVLTAAVSGKLTNTAFEKEIFKLDSEEWDIPKSWQRVNLHELINTSKPICYGVVQPGDEVDDGKLLIRVCDIYEGEVDYSNLRTISPEVDKQYLRSKVNVGDILVTIVGAIGRIGIVREDIEANIARAVAKISPNFKLVLPMYLHIWLSSPVLQWWLVNSSKEVARKTLNLKELKEAPVALPSLDEQAEIVRHVEQLFTFADNIEQKVHSALVRVNNLTQSILAKAFRGEFTANWRSAHPELISGENSANTLLEKIKAERESIKRQPKPKRPTVKKMTGSRMSKQRIKVVEVLKQTGKPLSGQQLLAAAGYPSDSSTDQLEHFFLELRNALTIEKSIIKLERDDDSQDWFALATPSINKEKD
ncbi:restriction endonuclease subunit S [Salmonella enterica]|nr:restriction endonuclease subunit S [Salmonella enterica]EGA1331760.1 restriction endonuclease subunit S [Salmonella enterica]